MMTFMGIHLSSLDKYVSGYLGCIRGRKRRINNNYDYLFFINIHCFIFYYYLRMNKYNFVEFCKRLRSLSGFFGEATQAIID